MSQPPLTPATWQAALALCRSKFALGGEPAMVGLLQREFQFTDEQADRCFVEMFAELSGEFAAEKADPRPKATAFYRQLKQDEDAGWSTRLTAQTRIDELWELVDLAQLPGSQTDALVNEAYAFYNDVLQADSARQTVKSRARRRLDLLMNGRQRRARSSSPRALPSIARGNARRPPGEQRLVDAWQSDAVARVAGVACPPVESGATVGSKTGVKSAPLATPSTGGAAIDATSPAQHAGGQAIHVTPPLDTVGQASRATDLAELDISPELDAAIKTAIAADPTADPFEIALDMYLNHKYREVSPAAPDPGAAGQPSPHSTARAPPGDPSAA